MAYFPDVSRGQEFQPNSVLANNVRHLVNSMNGLQSCGLLGANSGIVRMQVYNNSGVEIPAGTAVNFVEGGSLCGDAVPCAKLTDASKPWGVTVLKLTAKEMGDCVISGPAHVSLTGSGDYAQPSTSNPSAFTRGATGAPVIFAADGRGIVLLGGGGGGNNDYEGQFKISVENGMVNVIDAADPSQTIAGHVWLGTALRTIPAFSRALDSFSESRFSLYACVQFHPETEEFSFAVVADGDPVLHDSNNRLWYRRIGYCYRDGRVIQQYTGAEMEVVDRWL